MKGMTMAEKLASARKKEDNAKNKITIEANSNFDDEKVDEAPKELNSSTEKVSIEESQKKIALGGEKKRGKRPKIEIVPTTKKGEEFITVRIKKSSNTKLLDIKHKTGKYVHEIIEELLDQVDVVEEE